MTTYSTKLDRRDEIAEGTMSFHFTKPAGFHFKAGQAIDVILADPPGADARSAGHTFSIVSAPFQGELAIATRMRDSAFKRALKALPIGAPLKLEGPFGSFALHGDQARPAVFIAGGIGITPFMSILRQAAQDRLPHRLLLLYSNRRPEDAAFLSELQQLEQQNSNFRLVATMTEMSKSARKWEGETSFVNADLVKRHVADLAAPIYYVVGPPAMVEAVTEMLRGAGVAEDLIRSEEFYGY
ncbi:MAG TPA: FAD-dependent oxidoreductase [Burkholderiales bacterium]|nr:FAD-dependent oxidoreductase [Burkholderiales bacterium]